MTEDDAKAVSDKALVAMMSVAHMAGVPLFGENLPKAATAEHKAEVARRHRVFLAEQGTMDRYLDSRDQENDDLGKEIVLTPEQQETLYTFAQPQGAPATGDHHDRS